MPIKFPSDIRYNAKKPLEERYNFPSVGALLSNGFQFNYPDGALFNAVEDSTYNGKSYPAGLYEYKDNAWSLIETGGGLSDDDKAVIYANKHNGLHLEQVSLYDIIERTYVDANYTPLPLTTAVFGIDSYYGVDPIKDAKADGVIDDDNNLVNLPEGIVLAKGQAILDFSINLWQSNSLGKLYYDGEYIIDQRSCLKLWVGEANVVRFPSRTVGKTKGTTSRLFLYGCEIRIKEDDTLTVSQSLTNQVFNAEQDGVYVLTKTSPQWKFVHDISLYNGNKAIRLLDDLQRGDEILPLVQEVATIDDKTSDTDIPSVGAIRKFVGEGSGGGGSISGSVCTEAQINSLTF